MNWTVTTVVDVLIELNFAIIFPLYYYDIGHCKSQQGQCVKMEHHEN